MTTITRTPDPTPPTGAEPDIWEDDGHRDVYASVGCVLRSADILSCPLVTTIARQDQTGALDHIRIAVEADADLTVGQARELAGYLTQAADIADQWAGSTSTDGRLSAEAGAVIQALLSIATAESVTR